MSDHEHTPVTVHGWRTILQSSTWKVGDVAVITRGDGTDVYAEVAHVEAWGDTGANVVEFTAPDPIVLASPHDATPSVPHGPVEADE